MKLFSDIHFGAVLNGIVDYAPMLMLRHGKCSGLFNGRVPLFWINPSIFPRNMLRDYAPTDFPFH
jgi:hypothetical protein